MKTSNSVAISGHVVGRILMAGAVAIAFVALASGQAFAAAPSVAILNEQREANGIPPVAEDPSRVSWCPDESRATGAGGVSSLTTWSANSNPFAGSPIHESVLFDPTFTSAGVAVVDGSTCVDMGGEPPADLTSSGFHQYVGPMGPGAVEPSEVVGNELPYNPLERDLGLSIGQEVGPIMYVYNYAWSTFETTLAGTTDVTPHAEVVGASLVDGSGRQVPVLTDGWTVVPPSPLKPATTYTITVSWQGGSGQAATQSFSFTTTGKPASDPGDSFLRVKARVRGHRVFGSARFSPGDRGRIVIALRCGGASKRLHVYGRRTAKGTIKFKGRAPARCEKAKIVGMIGPAPGFQKRNAKPVQVRL